MLQKERKTGMADIIETRRQMDGDSNAPPDTFKGPYESPSISSTSEQRRDAQVLDRRDGIRNAPGDHGKTRGSIEDLKIKGYYDRPFGTLLMDYRDKVDTAEKGGCSEWDMLGMFPREKILPAKTVRELSDD